eukprot:516805-Pelagomonas_calceolata.AAC.7
MKVPDRVQRNTPSWMYLSEKILRMQRSSPHGILVLPLEGRSSVNSPRYMAEQTQSTAQGQHRHTIGSLSTKILRGVHRNKRLTLHTSRTEVAGTNLQLNQFTIEPLCELGLPEGKALKPATTLHCHAANTLTKKINTKCAIQFSNLNNGDWGGG